ncbi:hypothetical protein BDR07DRAFT_1432980 [Suillus spraguei]|nr:hypothetical protein BDR07DRAFT_1432980 [Suillus spraguei]
MPPWIRVSIPSRDLSVDTLLNLPINLAFDNVDKGSAPTFFSKNHALPDSDLPKDFLSRPIPSLVLSLELQQLFGQAWLDGYHSIIHTAFSTTPLPFWVLPYCAWWAARDWVKKRQESADDDGFMVVMEILDVLGRLPWDVSLKGFGAEASL